MSAAVFDFLALTLGTVFVVPVGLLILWVRQK